MTYAENSKTNMPVDKDLIGVLRTIHLVSDDAKKSVRLYLRYTEKGEYVLSERFSTLTNGLRAFKDIDEGYYVCDCLEMGFDYQDDIIYENLISFMKYIVTFYRMRKNDWYTIGIKQVASGVEYALKFAQF